MGCLCPKPINSNRPSEPFPPRNAVNVVERDCGTRYDRQVQRASDVDADDSMMSKFPEPQIPKHRPDTNDHSSERRIGTPPKNYKKTQFTSDSDRGIDLYTEKSQFKATMMPVFSQEKSEIYEDGSRQLKDQALGNRGGKKLETSDILEGFNLGEPPKIAGNNPYHFQESLILGPLPPFSSRDFKGSRDKLAGECLIQISAFKEMQEAKSNPDCDGPTKTMIDQAQSNIIQSMAFTQQQRGLGCHESKEDSSEKLTNSILMQMTGLRQLQTNYIFNEATNKMITDTENQLVHTQLQSKNTRGHLSDQNLQFKQAMSESVSAQMYKFQEIWGAYGGTNSNSKGIAAPIAPRLGTSTPDDIKIQDREDLVRMNNLEEIRRNNHTNKNISNAIDTAEGMLAYSVVMNKNPTGQSKMTPLEGSVMFQVNHLNEMGRKYGCDENTKKMIIEAQALLLRSVAYGQTRNLRAGEGNLTNSVLFQMDALKKLETKYGSNDTSAKMIHETEKRLVNNQVQSKLIQIDDASGAPVEPEKQAQKIITGMGNLFRYQMEYGVNEQTAKMIQETRNMMASNEFLQKSLLGISSVGLVNDNALDAGADEDSNSDLDYDAGRRRSKTMENSRDKLARQRKARREEESNSIYKRGKRNKIVPIPEKPKTISRKSTAMVSKENTDYKTQPSIRTPKKKYLKASENNTLMQSKLLLEVSHLKTLSKDITINDQTKAMIAETEKNILEMIKQGKLNNGTPSQYQDIFTQSIIPNAKLNDSALINFGGNGINSRNDTFHTGNTLFGFVPPSDLRNPTMNMAASTAEHTPFIDYDFGQDSDILDSKGKFQQFDSMINDRSKPTQTIESARPLVHLEKTDKQETKEESMQQRSKSHSMKPADQPAIRDCDIRKSNNSWFSQCDSGTEQDFVANQIRGEIGLNITPKGQTENLAESVFGSKLFTNVPKKELLFSKKRTRNISESIVEQNRIMLKEAKAKNEKSSWEMRKFYKAFLVLNNIILHQLGDELTYEQKRKVLGNAFGALDERQLSQLLGECDEWDKIFTSDQYQNHVDTYNIGPANLNQSKAVWMEVDREIKKEILGQTMKFNSRRNSMNPDLNHPRKVISPDQPPKKKSISPDQAFGFDSCLVDDKSQRSFQDNYHPIPLAHKPLSPKTQRHTTPAKLNLNKKAVYSFPINLKSRIEIW